MMELFTRIQCVEDRNSTYCIHKVNQCWILVFIYPQPWKFPRWLWRASVFQSTYLTRFFRWRGEILSYPLWDPEEILPTNQPTNQPMLNSWCFQNLLFFLQMFHSQARHQPIHGMWNLLAVCKWKLVLPARTWAFYFDCSCLSDAGSCLSGCWARKEKGHA